MKTIVVQIGNSDDKLPQKRWSEFVHAADELIQDLAEQVHFSGASGSAAPWQNACWVLVCDEVVLSDSLVPLLRNLADVFHQESIAVTVGDTRFI